jgi:hypothetical protein
MVMIVADNEQLFSTYNLLHIYLQHLIRALDSYSTLQNLRDIYG